MSDDRKARESGPSGDCGGSNRPGRNRDRGQLVLVAAGVIAIALLPVIVAYTQLGYAGVATTEPTAASPPEDALGALERAAFSATTDEQGVAAWGERSGVATAVAARFDARATSVETARVERGRVHEVERNQSAAAAWAADACPGGPDRQFGPCEPIDGMVLQERVGQTHVVAVAVNLRTVAEGGEYAGTYVLDAEVGERPDATP